MAELTKRSKAVTIAALLGFMLVVSCWSYSPYVNYTPAEWNYKRSNVSDPSKVDVYMQGKEPSKPYTVVGSGYAALLVGTYTVEQGIEALRTEASKRGCNAIIRVRYYQENKEIPARGGIGGNGNGFGGGYTGSYTVPAGFVLADFVVMY